MSDTTIPTTDTNAAPPVLVDTPFTQGNVAELAELREAVAAAEQRAEAAEQAVAGIAGKPARFAVYDTTYEKFLPGTYDDRKAADKASKAATSDDAQDTGRLQVREV